MTTRV